MKPKLKEIVESTLIGFAEIRKSVTASFQREVDRSARNYINNITRDRLTRIELYKFYEERKRELDRYK